MTLSLTKEEANGLLNILYVTTSDIRGMEEYAEDVEIADRIEKKIRLAQCKESCKKAVARMNQIEW